MMRVVAFAWGEHPSSPYRLFEPMMELARRRHYVSVYGNPEDLRPSDAEFATIVDTADVAYFARHADPDVQRLAQRLKDAGIAVVWDHDDDYIARRKHSTDPQEKREVDDIYRMIEIADVVTTTGERVAERYREEGAKHVIPVPNYLTRNAVETLPQAHEGFVLGYIGWVDHQHDWEQLGVVDAARRLLDEHPELRVEVLGPLEFDLPSDRYHRREIAQFEEIPLFINRFDIAIAPLMDIPGNRSRSPIKVMEYALAGVPWLASPVGPYEDLGEEQGGRLVEDDEWYEELDDLIRDKRARKKLGKRGTKWARELTMPARIREWEAALETALELTDERRAAAA
jgi:glycosyltransferase involved in cell wall biosynthesis